MDVAGISIGLAFAAGVVSFVSPCVLPLAPVYLANLTGAAAQGARGRSGALTTFIHAALFVLGFSIVFVLLGVLVGWLGLGVRDHITTLSRIAGGFVIVFGLHMIGLIRIPLLYRTMRLDFNPNTKLGYGRSLFLGSGFALGWTPCIGPTLGAVLSLGLNSGQIGESAFLLAVYSVGLGIPFLALGAVAAPAGDVMKRLSRHMHLIEVASGAILVAAGVLLVTNSLTRFNAFFNSGLGSSI
ncbi:MAG: cytochrome c biogenesis protein CcdA [Chloroflexi bacterium]|nr:cytochrome c biogenesis protein CcdA [Chloroflexota bacterium]